MYRLVWLLTLGTALAAAPLARFAPHTIASDLKGGYQITVADVNHDGKPDLIAVASGIPELYWFENPGWERHLIASVPRQINLAAQDIDGDGIPEIVLASEFSNIAAKSLGVVAVLRHQGDPRGPWSITEIDRLPTSHRIRWADFEGNGRKVAVNAPLTGPSAQPPDFRGHTPLVFYRPPAPGSPDASGWKREIIGEETEGVMHGIHVVDWDGDGRDEILTASFVGIHLYKLGQDGRWSRTALAAGDPSPWPKSGSSDVTVGRLGKRRFLAAIEPWHGNQVAVYTGAGGRWARNVIDSSYLDGHTIAAADLNGDGRDEIVGGYRGKGRSVYVYSAADGKGARWTRAPLDEGGMGAASCAVADLNADRRPDVVCIDSPNLKWYENRGQ